MCYLNHNENKTYQSLRAITKTMCLLEKKTRLKINNKAFNFKNLGEKKKKKTRPEENKKFN
jgi:hypothetical protein